MCIRDRCGGLGTRLGTLTAKTPKPLLLVGNRPFLEILLREIGRYGFDRVVLLSGFEGQQIEKFARDVKFNRNWRRAVRGTTQKPLPVAREPHGNETVSYTHLDVYKRQVTCSTSPVM